MVVVFFLKISIQARQNSDAVVMAKTSQKCMNLSEVH